MKDEGHRDEGLEKIEAAYERCKGLLNGIFKYAEPEDVETVIDLDDELRDSISKLKSRIEDLPEEEFEKSEKLLKIYGSLEGLSRQSSNHISSLVIKSNEKTIKASKRGFVDQLAVFSIVLTVLTFILDITNVFSIESSNFFSVMASVTSFILMATVMFSLIYIFLHLDDRHESAKRTWGRYIFMAVTVVALCYATCWLSNRANDEFVSKSCECETCLSVEEQTTAEPTINPAMNSALATANIVTSEPNHPQASTSTESNE